MAIHGNIHVLLFAYMDQVCYGFQHLIPLQMIRIRNSEMFRNVFELSYSRYIDLEKAEAQAREAQIEAGIGKSSCKNNGDAKSDELRASCLLFSTIAKLGFRVQAVSSAI